jgi:hypothetical protein
MSDLRELTWPVQYCTPILTSGHVRGARDVKVLLKNQRLAFDEGAQQALFGTYRR